MKKFKIVSMVLVIAMILSNFSFVFAVKYPKQTMETIQMDNLDEEVSVIIELEAKPILDCTKAQEIGAKAYLATDAAKNAKEQIINTQKSVQNEILDTINAKATFRFCYTNTLNGFAAVVQRKDIAKIKALPGVKNVYADLLYEIPEDEADPRLQTSTEIIGATNVWSLDGYKGEGTVVAVIDTGVDVNHEYMVVSDDTNVKLTKDSIANVLATSDLNAEAMQEGIITADDVYYNTKFPYCFDYCDNDTNARADSSNHGVHVSGIVAANGTVAQANAKANGTQLHTSIEFNGVAPEAQIIGMKVFPSKGGGAPTSCTIAAIEDAVSIGADALNLSLGSTAGYTMYEGEGLEIYEQEYSFAIARKSGIIVAVAAGNEDRAGLCSYLYNASSGAYAFPSTAYVDNGLVGSPGTKYHATTVASIENNSMVLPYLTCGDGYKFYYNDNTNFVERLDKQTLEYVVVPGLGEEKDFEGLDVNGKIALIERGSINFSVKVLNAQNAGAVAAIIYNNEANGDDRGGMLLEGIDIPAILIGRTYGLHLVNMAEENKNIIVDASCTEGVFTSPTLGVMSSFTSWGCNPDLKLKPEITAPGTNIYSTSTDNEYVTMQGTSMACPHIAGAAALLQQYVNDNDDKFGGYTAEEKANIIESLIMSTADIIYDEYDCQYSPRRQGAGLADLVAATTSDVYLLNETTGKAKVELGDKIGNSFSIEFDAYNLSNEAHDYQLVGSVFTEYPQQLNPLGYFILPYSYDLTQSEMFADGHTINPALAITPSGITGSAIVTVPAGKSVRIKVNVELSEQETGMFSYIFENGFFVEGFVKLQAIDKDQPDLSIPYMGFYGDWNKAPIVDGSGLFESYYDENNLRNYIYGNSYPYSYEFDENGEMTGSVYSLGSNYNGDLYAYPLVAFSPNGDNYFDQVGYKAYFLRNPKTLEINVIDSEGEIVKTLLDDIYWRKSYADYDSTTGQYYISAEFLDTWDGTDEEGKLVDDGQYYYVISATIDYPDATPQNTIIPVKVDTQNPSITSVVFDKDNMTVTVTASDNSYLSYAVAQDSIGDEYTLEALDVPVNSNVFVFDVSSFVGDKAILAIGDVAGNEIVQTVVLRGTSSGNPTPSTPTPTPSTPTPEEPDTEDVEDLEVPEDSIVVNQNENKVEVEVDSKVVDLVKDSKADNLVVSFDDYQVGTDVSIVVPKEVVEQLLNNDMDIIVRLGDSAVFTVNVDKAGELNIIMNKAGQMDASSEYTTTSYCYDIVVTLDGVSIVNNDKAVKVEINVSDIEDLGKAGVYTVDENGNLEYVMTYLNGDVISFYPPHFSHYCVMIYNKTFSDIKGHWAQEYIEDMASKHVVKGKTETAFAPEDTITRAEFVTMVVRALGLNGEGKSTFANITSDKWYANYMSLAKDAGLIEGTTYNAESIISRAEMAKIIARAHAILNGNTVEFDGTLKFTDVAADSEYAEYIGYAVENGLINGFPGDLFMPVENTTRAQAMTVIHKLLNK